MVLRAGLPAVRQLFGAGTKFVGTQPLQLLALAEENAEVRSKELVAGACQEIAIQSANVNRAMRRVVYSVNERHGACCVRQSHNFLHIVDGAHRVGSPSHRYHASIAANLRRQVEHIKGAIARLDVGGANLYTALFQAHPRRDIGVVVQTAHQQLVPALQVSAQGTTQSEGQGGHVGAENDFIGRAVEEVSHGGARIGNHLIGALAGDEGPAGIRVVRRQVIGYRVNHALRDLSTAWSVEEDGRLAVDLLMQRRKLLTHPLADRVCAPVRRFLHLWT